MQQNINQELHQMMTKLLEKENVPATIPGQLDNSLIEKVLMIREVKDTLRITIDLYMEYTEDEKLLDIVRTQTDTINAIAVSSIGE